MLELKAKSDGCEACIMGAPFYAPCNKPPVYMVGWPTRNDGPYRMCAMCADHNMRNRGASKISDYKAKL